MGPFLWQKKTLQRNLKTETHPPSSPVEGLDTETYDKDEYITPSSPGSSDKTEETPTSPIGTRISTEYSPRDTSLKGPFSSFWSGNLGDVSDIINRPRRLILVEPILSPFETLENPLIPKDPRPHKDSTSSESSIDTGPDSDMAATGATKDLIEALTKTLKNINQSPTIPLPVFKGKKGEDPEDHILKVEYYFRLHQIDDQQDKIKRFKDTLFETARKWAQTLNYAEEVVKFDYDPAIEDDKKASMKYLFLRRFAKEGRTLEAAYSAWGSLTFDPN